MKVYLARDIPAFVMYCVNGESGSSLLIVYRLYDNYRGLKNKDISQLGGDVLELGGAKCRKYMVGLWNRV